MKIVCNLYLQWIAALRGELKKAGIDDSVLCDQDCAIRWQSWQRRIVPAAKRGVVKADGFSCAPVLQKGLENLESAFSTGAEVWAWQSKLIDKPSCEDGLFNDYKVVHFHLGVGSVRVGPTTPGGIATSALAIGQDEFCFDIYEVVDESQPVSSPQRHTGHLTLMIRGEENRQFRRRWSDTKSQRLEKMLTPLITTVQHALQEKRADRLDAECEQRQKQEVERRRTAARQAEDREFGWRQQLIQSATCARADGCRRDSAGLIAFKVECVDNGLGCAEPEVLRRVGSSTSDLHPEARGRFGQGLIDLLAICEHAEIRTLRHRLVFDDDGCAINAIKKPVHGMFVTALLRHAEEGLEEMATYFSSVILPPGVTFLFNGHTVEDRCPERVISDVKLTTVVFDAAGTRFRQFQRSTKVEIYPKFGASPRIYELGIPVDDAPWELPFDINVLQKTPLDTERDMLPQRYKSSLIAQLVGPLSDQYIAFMRAENAAPLEIKNDPLNVENLTPDAQELLVKTVTGADIESIVRRNPLDKDDLYESQELESRGFMPLNRGILPAGVSHVLKDSPTVAAKHDEVCKPHLSADKRFPPETEQQRKCMAVFAEIASTLVGKPVRCERISGAGATATWNNRTLHLNIDVHYLWNEPLGPETLGVILHECAHDHVSGHNVDFADEVARLGGKLAGFVGQNPSWWDRLHSTLAGSAEEELVAR